MLGPCQGLRRCWGFFSTILFGLLSEDTVFFWPQFSEPSFQRGGGLEQVSTAGRGSGCQVQALQGSTCHPFLALGLALPRGVQPPAWAFEPNTPCTAPCKLLERSVPRFSGRLLHPSLCPSAHIKLGQHFFPMKFFLPVHSLSLQSAPLARDTVGLQLLAFPGAQVPEEL